MSINELNDEDIIVEEYMNDDKSSNQNKLMTIDELIKEKTKQVFEDLNKEASKAFNQGQLSFVYYIPYILWETEEFINELNTNMALSGWTFGEIENFKYEGDHKKKVRFIFCEEG